MSNDNTELTRRAFLKGALAATTLASEFALAVEPVQAGTVIHTSSTGLLAGKIDIATRDGHIPGYAARPEAGGDLPVVLVIQEVFGVHEHIRDVCRRFAHHGYVAVAPELYYREGDVSKISDIKALMPIVQKVPDAQVMTDLDAAAEWAYTWGGGSRGRLAATGFCWGGRIAWLYAAHSADVRAVTAWYGRLIGPTDPLHPWNPIDISGQVNCPVLALYGGKDDSITQDSIAQMRAQLAASGKTAELIVYPDAAHGFHADYRPSYNAAASMDGERRMYRWFRRHGAV